MTHDIRVSNQNLGYMQYPYVYNGSDYEILEDFQISSCNFAFFFSLFRIT